MRYFYEMYPDAVICPQVEDKLITDVNRPQVGDDRIIILEQKDAKYHRSNAIVVK